ncbi:MAG: family 10 glycosylhydrolase [Clostridiales bacterium]|nr:family 10 glycosylhydrolase [Clostridiales bacterium]
MNIKKYLWGFVAAVVAVGTVSCSDDNSFDPFAEAPEPPIPNVVPDPPVIKPKAMWIDAHANFAKLSTKAGIDAELQKIKDNGMNMIYLDVKPGNGYALYKSDILPYCNQIGDEVVTRDYDDYLGYFLEKCKELKIDVVASVVATGFGHHTATEKQGYIYDHLDQWYDKCQVRSVHNQKGQFVNIADDASQPIVMLSPASPEAQDLIVRVINELVSKYPDLKGISLDYLRYCNNDGGWYGMGSIDLNAYASYWSEPVPDPEEIVTVSGGIGPKFAKWIEYRSATITSLLSRIRSSVKNINPNCEIHLWASADWGSRYSIGQNWASKNYKPSGGQYTDTYSKTGFADLLDVFITGAYSEKVWSSEDPSTIWTVENFVKTWNNYIMGDCKCYGSIAAYALDQAKTLDATYLCLKYTDGYMTFELSHVGNRGLWDATRLGILRYEDPSTYVEDSEDNLY